MTNKTDAVWEHLDEEGERLQAEVDAASHIHRMACWAHNENRGSEVERTVTRLEVLAAFQAVKQAAGRRNRHLVESGYYSLMTFHGNAVLSEK
jgi:hypothetical protein